MKQTYKPSILFVDDEANILRGLRRELRKQRAQWEMDFVPSGEEAIDVLKHRDFDILVTDMLMPGVDGAELLSWVSFNKPGIVRFILSGEADPKLTYQTVGRSHRFFSKPCEGARLISALKSVVGEVVNRRTVDPKHTVMGLLCSPQSVFDEIMRLKSMDAKLQDYIGVISIDPSLALRILQLVNSAYFGAPVATCSVSRALKVIGLSRFLELFNLFRLGESYDDCRFGQIYKPIGYTPDQLATALYEKVKQHTNDHSLIMVAYACGLFAHLRLLGDLLAVAHNPIVPSYHTAVFGLPIELSQSLALLEKDDVFLKRSHRLNDVAERAAQYIFEVKSHEHTTAAQKAVNL